MQRSVRAIVLASGAAGGLASTGACAFAVSGGVFAGVGVAAEVAVEGTEFVVGAVEVVYAPGTSGGIAPSELAGVDVELVRQSSGLLIAPGSGAGTPVTISLGNLSNARTERFDSSGLRSVLEAIHERYTTRTGGKAYVVPDATQVLLRGIGEDYRTGSSGLRFVVYPSRGTNERPTRATPAPSTAASSQPATTPEPRPRPAAQPQQVTPAPAASVQRPAEQPAGSASTPAPTQSEAPAIVETTDPDDGGREPPARMDRSTTVRVVPQDGTVYDPDDLPVEQFEFDAEIDGESPFEMTGFEFSFPKPHPDLPAPEALGDVTVRLIRTPSGFVAREGQGKLVRLGDLGVGGSDRLYFSAFEASLAAVLQSFRDDSIVGVLVTPDPDKGIGPDEVERYYDERSEYGVTTLPILVYVPQVTRLKTIASGDRIDTEDRLNSPKHARITRGSPLQPGEGEMPNALLRFEPLNTYAFQQSRHPGRRVDVAIADGSVPGEPETQGDAEVQYLVQEIKPWTIYAQFSNTGTEQTDQFRERVGFVNNQLLGFDDIFSIDYITSNLRESHAIVTSYDVPLSDDGRLRAKVEGEWSEYKASDVGVANESFEGRTYGFGGELRYNFLQVNDFFVDVYGGGKYRDIEVENLGLVNGRGQEEVFVFDVGLRAERVRANYSIFAEVGLEISANGITGANEADLERLGRLNPDEEWTALHWDVDHSFYLDGIGSWNSGNRQLVHEIASRFSGQYAFNNRLIPNYQTVGGGLYTVRGYRESLVAGDNGVFASVEYRFHLPKALPAGDQSVSVFGESYRVRTDSEGLAPDWDFILKAFFDVGYVNNSRALGFESDESLMGTGLGAELRLAGNLSFRTDWGIVLDEIGSDTPSPTTVGSQRWHFVFTLLY
mgnify:CR=1 FL=1